MLPCILVILVISTNEMQLFFLFFLFLLELSIDIYTRFILSQPMTNTSGCCYFIVLLMMDTKCFRNM